MSGWGFNDQPNPGSDSQSDAWLHEFDFDAFLEEARRNEVSNYHPSHNTNYEPFPFNGALSPSHVNGAAPAHAPNTNPPQQQQLVPNQSQTRAPAPSQTDPFAQRRHLPQPRSRARTGNDPFSPHDRPPIDVHLGRRVSSFNHVPDQFFQDFAANVSDTYGQSEFQELPESNSKEEEKEMAPTTRRRNQSTIDLTAEQSGTGASVASLSQPHGGKRAAESSQHGRSKRARVEAVKDEEPEEVDLTSEEALQQTQLRDAVKSQQQSSKEHEGPVRIGKRTCIICMDNYTNATVTACGHIYCHECLSQALNASAKSNDRNMGSCPACRKRLYAPTTKKGKDQIIPIAFMKKSAFKGKAKRYEG